MPPPISLAETLPADAGDALLVGRAWIPDEGGERGGPTLVAVRDAALIDITYPADLPGYSGGAGH